MSSSTIVAPVARSAGLNAESWPAALAKAMKQGITGIGSRRRLRRHIDELRTLDDRMLRDIILVGIGHDFGGPLIGASQRHALVDAPFGDFEADAGVASKPIVDSIG